MCRGVTTLRATDFEKAKIRHPLPGRKHKSASRLSWTKISQVKSPARFHRKPNGHSKATKSTVRISQSATKEQMERANDALVSVTSLC